MKPGNEQLDSGLAVGGALSSGGRYNSGVMAAGAGRTVRDACRRFSRVVDWQYLPVEPSDGSRAAWDDPGPDYRLSEDHEGLHSGRYINITFLPGANRLVVRGGCYDRCRQPEAVYYESLPLGGVTALGLGRLLMEMHDGLGRHARTRLA